MTNDTKPSVQPEDVLASLRREIAMRNRVYPQWVFHRRMSAEQAAREIVCMETALCDLVEFYRSTGRLAQSQLFDAREPPGVSDDDDIPATVRIAP